MAMTVRSTYTAPRMPLFASGRITTTAYLDIER